MSMMVRAIIIKLDLSSFPDLCCDLESTVITLGKVIRAQSYLAGADVWFSRLVSSICTEHWTCVTSYSRCLQRCCKSDLNSVG